LTDNNSLRIDDKNISIDNTSLDVRNLTKLEDLHTLKTTRIKAKSSWVRKTFNKKNWACVFVKNGIIQKKVKASKKKVKHHFLTDNNSLRIDDKNISINYAA